MIRTLPELNPAHFPTCWDNLRCSNCILLDRILKFPPTKEFRLTTGMLASCNSQWLWRQPSPAMHFLQSSLRRPSFPDLHCFACQAVLLRANLSTICLAVLRALIIYFQLPYYLLLVIGEMKHCIKINLPHQLSWKPNCIGFHPNTKWNLTKDCSILFEMNNRNIHMLALISS